MSQALLLDHVTTYIESDELARHLDGYRRAGFEIDEREIAHPNGVRGGHVRLGDEYLELLAVVDMDTFDRDAPTNDKIMYLGQRPFAVGLKAPDIAPVRADWVTRGIDAPAIDVLRPYDERAQRVIELRVLQIPLKAMRGASCFVIEKPVTPRELVAAPNGVVGLAGISLVSIDAGERVAQWRGVLGAAHEDSRSIAVGPHRVHWLTPGEYGERFGIAWTPAKHPLGEIGAVHLCSVDLARTEQYLTAAGRTVRRTATGDLVVEADPGDGLVLVIGRASELER